MNPRKTKLKRRTGTAGNKTAPSAPAVSRENFIQETKAYLKLLTKPVIEGRTPTTPGKECVGNFTRMVDTITGLLFQRAVTENGVSPDKAQIAVIAMGGYGRSELAPYSDIDILVVCRKKTPEVDAMAGAFIRYMWDAGFELGHTVESLVESETALAQHMDTKTALIESRWVCGSRRIARAIERQIFRIRRKERKHYLRRKVKDALVRYEKYGHSFQLIEPNVKASPGGMRDFQTLVWLGQVNTVDRGLGALRKKGLLLRGEHTELEEAYDFLLRVRFELHLITRSKQDQLTVVMQRKLARALGYRSRGGHLDVEYFMRDYYNHTRAIYRITADILKELRYGDNVSAILSRRKTTPASGSPDTLTVRVIRKRIRNQPLYVFERQKETGLPLDRALRRRLVDVLDEELKGAQAARRMRLAFAAMLEDGNNLGLVIRSLHETRFLGKIIPEYNRLTCLKRYDLYHHYTVDEHSFRVLENILALDSGDRDPNDPMVRLYTEIDDKRPLFLAALLHDVGKIEGHGHAKTGAVLVKKILARMKIPAAEAEFVSFLVRHHLVMSQFSQRRDPADIGTLKAFCRKVRDRKGLKALCLLTYADYKATSPVVWNRWKQNLLWGLYLRAYEFITNKEKAPEAVYKAHKKSLLDAFPAGGSRDEALAHLDLLPGGYLIAMDGDQVKLHMEMVDALDGRRAVVAHRKRIGLHEFTFCTVDQPYRLSQLCGVLTVNNFNIFQAHAFTRKDGIVIDVFGVEDIRDTGGAVDQSGENTDIDGGSEFAKRIESVQRDIEAAITGDLDLDEANARHAARWRRARQRGIPAPGRVKFENDLSGDFTIIDVFAQDVPGLLFRITGALSREGLRILRARISTEADRAIDSFYVGDEAGRKIKAARDLNRIRMALEREIGLRK